MNFWKEARSMFDFAADEKKFDEWELRVESLLDPAEREFYVSPYDGLDMRYLGPTKRAVDPDHCGCGK